MNRSITPNQIKQNNRNLIYSFIYKNRNVSQQDIAYNLRLSRPTVAANLNALENDGLVQKNGHINTEFVGRKAAAYSIIPDFRVSIGVEILEEKVEIIAVDLYGEQIDHRTYDIVYENKDAYFKKVCEEILIFKDFLGFKDEQILGIGLAMQGLISSDKRTVLYGKILSDTGLSIETFTKYLHYPCSFIHDVESAAVFEKWTSPELENAFYLALNWHFGSAIISKGKILTGKHGNVSTVEHIQIRSAGALCYCGKRGCVETVCSLTALLSDNEKPEDFFRELRQQNPAVLERWDRYLSDLAGVINMLHLVFDTDFILGGHLALYLCEEDIAILYEKIQQLMPFDESQDFLLVSKMPQSNIIIGAALPYIQEFLDGRPD